MSSDVVVRDALEFLMVLAVGGILVSAVRRWRAGRITIYRCRACGRAIARVYDVCPKCGASQDDTSVDRSTSITGAGDKEI